jgi:serine/threonine protein kinase
MRQCPRCRRLYDGSHAVCAEDGTALLVPEVRPGVLVDGKYRLDEPLGAGSMGFVYKATQLAMDRVVALKVIQADSLRDPQSVARFKREAMAAARLSHPNVVTIYDFGVSVEVGAYLVMELLEGHTLERELSERGRLPPREALDLLREICAGVHAAHEAYIIHRDLSPRNVFLVTGSTNLRAKVPTSASRSSTGASHRPERL